MLKALESPYMMAKIIEDGAYDMVIFEEDDQFTDTEGKIVKPEEGSIVRVHEFPKQNLVSVQNISLNNFGQVTWEVSVDGGTIEDFVNKAVTTGKEH